MEQGNARIVQRQGTPDDHNLIFSTWLKGLRHGNDWYGLIDQKSYFQVYHKVIEGILENPNTEVLITCLEDAPQVILGYSILSRKQTVLHWVFVKKAWRGIGIGRNLMPPTLTTVTHVTKTGLGMLKKHPEIVFNPFVL